MAQDPTVPKASSATKGKFFDEVAAKVRKANQVLLVCEYDRGVEMSIMQPEHGILSPLDDTNQLRIMMATQRMCEQAVRNRSRRAG